MNRNNGWQGPSRRQEGELRAVNRSWIVSDVLVVVQQQRRAAGAPPCLSFWGAPPAVPFAGKRTLLLPRDPASRRCCRALLSSALEDCFKPKLNSSPPQRQKKPKTQQPAEKKATPVQPFPVCLLEQGEQQFSGEKVLTAGFLKNRHHVTLKDPLKFSFTNNRRNYSSALCF